MAAVSSCLIESIWERFQTLIPHVVATHPRGCHRPRIPDRIVFGKLVQVLVLGAAYSTMADTTCSATAIRTRRDEWFTVGIFTTLEQICLDAYDNVVRIDLELITVDGCLFKARRGGEVAGPCPVDGGKLGTKRSLMAEGAGIPIGCVTAPANLGRDLSVKCPRDVEDGSADSLSRVGALDRLHQRVAIQVGLRARPRCDLLTIAAVMVWRRSFIDPAVLRLPRYHSSSC